MKELLTIQKKLNAPKGRRNGFGNYKYRSCEDILAAVKPLLEETSCTLSLSDEIVMVGTRIYVKAIATLTNASGEKEQTTAYAREDESKKGMDVSQLTGATSSYARKYALSGLLAIDDETDSDVTNTSGEEAKADSVQLKTQAKKEAEAINSREGLVSWWSKYDSLHNDEEIKALSRIIGQKYPKA